MAPACLRKHLENGLRPSEWWNALDFPSHTPIHSRSDLLLCSLLPISHPEPSLWLTHLGTACRRWWCQCCCRCVLLLHSWFSRTCPLPGSWGWSEWKCCWKSCRENDVSWTLKPRSHAQIPMLMWLWGRDIGLGQIPFILILKLASRWYPHSREPLRDTKNSLTTWMYHTMTYPDVQKNMVSYRNCITTFSCMLLASKSSPTPEEVHHCLSHIPWLQLQPAIIKQLAESSHHDIPWWNSLRSWSNLLVKICWE